MVIKAAGMKKQTIITARSIRYALFPSSVIFVLRPPLRAAAKKFRIILSPVARFVHLPDGFQPKTAKNSRGQKAAGV
jgi:hypothetical protein